MITEAIATAMFCATIGGIEEVKHNYKHSYIKVDCETKTEVIEAGLDNRRSLDSLQQAIFFSILTNKKPVVVIYDTDDKEGKYEFRIRKSCEWAGVEYRSVRISSKS